MRTVNADLTARARIRDAAVARFAADGFGVGLREIAETAAVSLGLIRHHFGSKDALRKACDDWVLSRIRELQEQQARAAAPADALLAQLATSAEHAVIVRYLVRALVEGGALGRQVLDRMLADTRTYIDAGVTAGRMRPSVDADARARFLLMASMGALVLEFTLAEPGEDVATIWARYVSRTTLPALELYTQGLLTDRELLDSYLLYLKDPPAPSAE